MDGVVQQPVPSDLGPTGKCLVISAITLTLYDYMLLFDDEIRYVWKGRKTWIFYLYIANRILLVAFQLWWICYTDDTNNSEASYPAGYYIQVLVIMFFLFSSDIFVTLRIYAVTLRNKMVLVYFGTLGLTRLAIALVTAFISSPTTAMSLQFKLAPNTIGTAFDLSAFLVVVWYMYRNNSTRKFSALIRTFVTEATVYFLAMVAAQIYIQLSFNLMQGQQLSLLGYGLFNPILTLRFVISLRKSADPEGGQKWQLKHFSTPGFARVTPLDVQVPVILEKVDTDPVDPSQKSVVIRRSAFWDA